MGRTVTGKSVMTAMELGTTQADDLYEQVERARNALGEALGLVQDIGPTALDVEETTRLLAASVGALYDAEAEDLRDSYLVGQAMDNMRCILTRMQDETIEDVALEAATRTVARVLALLYPVYRALPEKVGEDHHGRDFAAPDASKRSIRTESLSDDRRDSRRVVIEAEMGMHSESNFFTGFSMDISSGGLFVATYDVPDIGTQVNLNFKIPGGPVLSVDGEVMWQRTYNESTPDIVPGIGVRFQGLSTQESTIINNYMEQIAPLFYDES